MAFLNVPSERDMPEKRLWVEPNVLCVKWQWQRSLNDIIFVNTSTEQLRIVLIPRKGAVVLDELKVCSIVTDAKSE